MLKPIIGAAALLLILVALLAGNLNSEIAIDKNQADSDVAQGAEEEAPGDRVFSRNASDPVKKKGPRQLEEADLYYNDEQPDNGFTSSDNDNSPYANSPFIDPNSGFAGDSGSSNEPTRPAAPKNDGSIQPGSLPQLPKDNRVVVPGITKNDVQPG